MKHNPAKPSQSTYLQNYFTPRNPQKYKGDLNRIIFRSSWEYDFCRFLDNNQRVLEWATEPFSIPYVKPTDGKVHRYFPDFWVKYMDSQGKVLQEVIEIKPLKQQLPPSTSPGKSKKALIYEAIAYSINQAKWEAARNFCDKYNMKFRLIGETQQYK